MKTCQASLRLVGRALQRSVQPSVHERRVQQSEHGSQAQPQGEDDMVSAGGASSDSLPGRVIIAVFLPRPARPFLRPCIQEIFLIFLRITKADQPTDF